MSITIDYSFNADLAPEQLAEKLGRRIGAALVRDGDDGPGEVFAPSVTPCSSRA